MANPNYIETVRPGDDWSSDYKNKRIKYNHSKKVLNTSFRVIVEGIAFDMANIPAGSFQMGEPDKSISVTMPYGFGACVTTITQELWRLVVEAHPDKSKQFGRELNPDPSHFKNNLHYPVESVSFLDVEEWLARLNELYIEECNRDGVEPLGVFVLPGEAQWEYSCRATTTTLFNTGKDTITTSEARFDSSSPCDVASFPSNLWGLWDMHGNVWEWCQDEWHSELSEMPEELRLNGNIPWTEDWQERYSQEYPRMMGGQWKNLYYPSLCQQADKLVVTVGNPLHIKA